MEALNFVGSWIGVRRLLGLEAVPRSAPTSPRLTYAIASLVPLDLLGRSFSVLVANETRLVQIFRAPHG